MSTDTTQQSTGADDLERLGGEEGIARWVEVFYAKVATDPLLGPLFTDIERAKEKQYLYFVEFFGGPPLYSQQHGKAFLRFKHRHFRIGQPERDAWMHLVMESLREVLGDAPEALAAVESRLGPIADAMINYRPDQQDAYYFQR